MVNLFLLPPSILYPMPSMSRLLYALFLLALHGLACIPAAAATQSIHVEWGYTPPSTPAVSGFKLYQEGSFVCQVKNPKATAMDCAVTLTTDITHFTLTAAFTDGTESPHSAPFAFTSSKAGSSGTTGASTSRVSTAVLSSSTAAGTSPLTISFDGSGSTAANRSSIISYSWNFGDGFKATGARTSHTFTEAGTYTTTLTIEDSQGGTSKASTPIVVTTPVSARQATSNNSSTSVPSRTVSATTPSEATTATSSSTTTANNRNTAGTGAARLALEAGEIGITSNWVHVPFASRYSNPILVVGPPNFSNSAPCGVRTRNVTATGFDVRIAEWTYQDDKHPEETISYLVMEKGRITLNNGSVVEAGSFTGSATARPISFSKTFQAVPVVLTTVTSTNEAESIAGRVHNINRSGFTYFFQEQESNLRADHRNETVHYVAWQPGIGATGMVRFEASSTGKLVSSSWSKARFQSAFRQPPLVLASLQTLANAEPSTLRVKKITTEGFQIKIQEERSKDREMKHPGEQVGYLAILPTGQ